MTILSATRVCVQFGPRRVLDGVDLTLEAGTLTGLIGPNGAGKTTLIDAISGFVPVTAGAVVVAGSDVTALPPHRRAARGVVRTFQSLELFDDLTVRENLLAAAEAVVGDTRFIAQAAQSAGITELLDMTAADLGHAQGKRVALARALAARPAVLLVDEPAAGLDLGERRALSVLLRDLASEGMSILVVDHDVELVLGTCDRVLVLDGGVVVADGRPDEIRRDPHVTRAYLGETLDAASRPGPGAGPRRPVLRARSLCAGYHGADVVTDLDLDVAAGELVALLGPNGAGKTSTLLALSGVLGRVSGQIAVLGQDPRRGAQRLSRAGLRHVLQGRAVFGSLTVAENLRLAARDGTWVLDRFPLLRGLREQSAGALSGGEQQLLALARAVAAHPKLLLVDELSLGLAPATVEELLSVLVQLARDDGVGVLFAEQHAQLALRVAQRAYVLRNGRVVLHDDAVRLRDDPRRLEAAYFGDSPPPRPASDG